MCDGVFNPVQAYLNGHHSHRYVSLVSAHLTNYI